MANVEVQNVSGSPRSVATILTEDEEEGRLFWLCACGAESEVSGNMADTIADAEVHVDHQCRYRD